MSSKDSFNPERDDPQNGAQRNILATYERLVDAGHEAEAASLKARHRGTKFKESLAHRLEREVFREPTTAEKAESTLDDPTRPT